MSGFDSLPRVSWWCRPSVTSWHIHKAQYDTALVKKGDLDVEIDRAMTVVLVVKVAPFWFHAEKVYGLFIAELIRPHTSQTLASI
ncbi:MAG: hypothetical protein WC901_04645 [Candidatus Margulisiibacteriota bacterium]